MQPGTETQILMKKYMLNGAPFRQVEASFSSGSLPWYTASLAGVAATMIAIVAWAWRVLQPVRLYGGLSSDASEAAVNPMLSNVGVEDA